MGWKNCLVIVKEKINPINYSDGSWSCAVLGLDNEEGAKFCQLLGLDPNAHNFHTLLGQEETIEFYDQRASKLIPTLEKMDYKFYNVSDNADIVANDKVVATWRFCKTSKN